MNVFKIPQGNNWITVGQYDSKSKEITLRRDPVFPGGVTRIPGKGRPTYKIAAFFPTHEDLGPLRDLGLEWQAAFRVAVELVNTGPFKVAFSYVLVDGGEDSKSCKREAEVGSCETFTVFCGFGHHSVALSTLSKRSSLFYKLVTY